MIPLLTSFRQTKKVLCSMLGVLLLTSIAFAQNAAITGKVTDKAGKGMAGATVQATNSETGDRSGAVSIANGAYKINNVRPGKYTLKVSYVGYKTMSQSLAITGSQDYPVNFSLAEDVLRAEEVVVTGLGGEPVSKQKLGVSIQKVEGKEIAESGTSNVIGGISGRASNVEVTESSGEPGAATYIRVRGATSINQGTQPLFVVDGVQIDNSTFGNNLGNNTISDHVQQTNRAVDIDPNNVESMEILKGAAAAAMYGSHAANGVILITTKKGKIGESKINVRESNTFEEVSQQPALQTKWGQGLNGIASRTSSASWGPQLDTMKTPPTGYKTTTFDHHSDIFQTGKKYEYGISASGGDGTTSYYFSADRTDHTGIIIENSTWERDALKLSAAHLFSDVFKISVSGNYIKSGGDRIQMGSNTSGLLLGLYRTPPNFDNRDSLHPNGLEKTYRNQSNQDAPPGYDNPFFTIRHNTNRSDVNRVYGNVGLDYDVLPWLKLNYTIGADFWNDERREFLAPGAAVFGPGQVTRTFINQFGLDHNLTATLSHNFSSNINSTLMLGQTLQNTVVNELNPYSQDIAVGLYEQQLTAVTTTPQEYQSVKRIEAYFAQATTDFYDMVYLVAGLRRDEASTFGPSEKVHYYPKLSGSFTFSKLEGMQNDIFNFGKIRLAYGENGREPDPYQVNGVYNLGGQDLASYGEFLKQTYNGNVGGWTSAIMGNPSIRPEVKKETEVGIDLNFFNDRSLLSITYYKSNIVDLIMRQALPASIGFIYQYRNVGAMTNDGLEVEFTALPVKTQDFVWTATVNWGMNKNKVTDLAGSEYVSLGGFTGVIGVAKLGEPLGIFYGTDFRRNPDGSMFVDSMGRPDLDQANKVIGDPNPKWTSGIKNTFGFLNNKLTLSVLVEIKHGGDIWNGTKGALNNFGTSEATADRGTSIVLDGGYWIDNGQVNSEGKGTFVRNTKSIVKDQNYYRTYANGFTGPASQFIEDGSYVKLRDIRLSYQLDDDLIASFGGNTIKGINVYVSAHNLKTWTKYTGVDPETNLAGSDNLRGFDYFNNPQTRSYAFGFNLDF